MARAIHGQAPPHRWLQQMFRPVHPEELTEHEKIAYQHFLVRVQHFVPLKGLVGGLLTVLCLLSFPHNPWPAGIFLLDALLLLPYPRLARRWPALSTVVLLTASALAITAADRFAGRPTATTGALYALLIVTGAVLLVYPRHIALLAALISLTYLLPLLALSTSGAWPDGETLQTAGIHTLAFLGLGGITGILTRLYQRLLETRTHQDLLTTLLAGLQEITSDTDLPSRLQHIAERAARATAVAERALLLVEEGGRLIVRGCAGYAGVPLLGLSFPADCLKEHDRPVSIRDILGERRKNLPAETLAALDNLPPTQSSILVPLIGREGPLGLLILSSSRHPDAFDEDTRQRLSLFAQQAAIALENARLVDRLQESLKELEQKTQELQLRQEELRGLIAAISQRLQGPVEALSGFVRLLRDSAASRLAPEEREYLQRIERNSRWVEDLVRDMLFLSRIDVVNEEREPISLTTLVQGVSTHLQMERRGVTVNVQEGMPSFQADPVLFWHLFSNLLQNAVRLLPPDGRPRLDVRCDRLPGAFRIVVQIPGRELAPDERKGLFDLFPPEGKGRTDGLHLGLGIARRIAQRYRGQLWVESLPGEGTSLCLLLPEAVREDQE